MIHRHDQLRASKIMAQRALDNSKIDILWNKIVVEVLGDEMISAIRLKDTVTSKESTLEVGGLFLAIGHTPATDFLKGQLELRATSSSKTPTARQPQSRESSPPATTDSVYRQAVTAAAIGCKAAIDAERWLAEWGIE